MRSADERQALALSMVTAKAVEGCSPCLDGYRRVAEEAGASPKTIELAVIAGQRARARLFAEKIPVMSQKLDSASVEDATAHLLTGATRTRILQEAIEDSDVQALDAHLRKLGYLPAEAERGASQLQLGDRCCMEVYLPYERGERDYSWISYRQGINGKDLVAVIPDMTRQQDLDSGRLPHESLIVRGGNVVPGHACDTGCFGHDLSLCCGPGWVACLSLGPAWWACTIATCGSCAVFACFFCGCC